MRSIFSISKMFARSRYTSLATLSLSYYVLLLLHCSFFGSLAVCTGQPFKYLVGTDKCENYLDFFGRVECSATGTHANYLAQYVPHLPIVLCS